MNYYSEKNGEVKGGVLAAFELGLYEDPEELLKITDWLEEQLGCEILLTTENDWVVKWNGEWIKLELLFGRWKREEKEWEKECEE